MVVLAKASFGYFFVFQVHLLFCFFAFDCYKRRSRLPGKTRLRNDLLYIALLGFELAPYFDEEWEVNPFSPKPFF